MAERLPGALNVAAKSMDMTVAEFLKQMELGAIKSEEFIPRFSKALNEFADPAYRANLEKTNFQFKRLSSEFTLFKEKVWKAGLGDILNSTFITLRHLLEAIGPLAQRVARWISVGFHLAAFPIRYLIASIADLMHYLGLTEGFKGVSDWADYVMGAVVAVGLLYGQFKLIAKILGVITGSMKLLSKSKGLLGGAIADQCGSCSTGDLSKKTKKGGRGKGLGKKLGGAAKTVGAGAASAAGKVKSGVMAAKGALGTAAAKAAPYASSIGRFAMGAGGTALTALLHSSKVGEGSDVPEEVIRKQMDELGITPEKIEQFKQEQSAKQTMQDLFGISGSDLAQPKNADEFYDRKLDVEGKVLGWNAEQAGGNLQASGNYMPGMVDKYMTMGPGAVLSPSEQKTVRIILGVDDNEASKLLKAKSQQEDVEFQSNFAR